MAGLLVLFLEMLGPVLCLAEDESNFSNIPIALSEGMEWTPFHIRRREAFLHQFLHLREDQGPIKAGAIAFLAQNLVPVLSWDSQKPPSQSTQRYARESLWILERLILAGGMPSFFGKTAVVVGLMAAAMSYGLSEMRLPWPVAMGGYVAAAAPFLYYEARTVTRHRDTFLVPLLEAWEKAGLPVSTSWTATRTLLWLWNRTFKLRCEVSLLDASFLNER